MGRKKNRMATTRQEQIDFVRGQVGEGVHTSLRKFTDSKEGADAWNAINKMSNEEWHGVCEIVAEVIVDGLKELK